MELLVWCTTIVTIGVFQVFLPDLTNTRSYAGIVALQDFELDRVSRSCNGD